MSQAVESLRKQLHISHSQLFTYLNCSLKFWFMYVQKLQKEHSSIALHFGTAIHSAIEILYLSLKETGKKPPLGLMEMNFSSRLYQGLEMESAPILFKKDMPDTATAVSMGKKMAALIHAETVFDGTYSIEGIELPLSADLYNHKGELMDIQLVGVIDLLLRDGKGFLVAVDHKTAKLSKSQSAVDNDLQLTAYSYLLAANKYVFARSEVQCRFNVIRKLKTPKLETYNSSRGPLARKRFARLASTVLAGIENQVYLPCRSWLCQDCEFSKACNDW